ncbi:MAG: PSD1 and planctomycete cytochrome C domain-containing protein [Pirellulaceae bacterium]|nr:PSD1 and planctomycete cytochrome C domain-containing protein [Pirellulaceae bacterium]
MIRTLTLFTAWLLPLAALHAADGSASEIFGHQVLPILHAKCLPCHGDNRKTMGNLDLSTLVSVLKGGESGPSIIRGKSADSLIVKQVIEGTMPPEGKGEPLTSDELSVVINWIDQSTFPTSEEIMTASPRELGLDHWAFQPRRPSIVPPSIDSPEWNRNPIDRFIAAEHIQQGIIPVALADNTTLLRRVTFDLTGLPPTLQEQEQFLEACALDADKAYGELVDRLLSLPAYGERWGRHWLDVARYADTAGCLADYPIPWMYRYREWVIKAFNSDLPYDEFVRWQLAGDILAKSAADAETYADQTIATGFIAASRRFGLKINEGQHLTIEDTIDTLGRGLMGITMRCARCHDHKFDPIPTVDYYALYGIFESTRYPFCGSSEYKTPVDLVSLSFDAQQRNIEEERMKQASNYTLQIRSTPALTKAKKNYDTLKEELELARQEGKGISRIESELLKLREKYPELREWFEEGTKGVTKVRAAFIEQWGDPSVAMAYSVAEGKCMDAAIQLRGDPKQQGMVVPRGALSAIRNVPSLTIDKGSGRLELAEWLTHPEHPLTARVLVNRVWQWHFGRGIVASSDSFGTMGTAPTHPELLDWLSNSFVEEKWSIKRLHRQILLSRAFRLGSTNDAKSRKLDSDNVYLWQFRPRRLEAEAIRDAMMMVGGTLDQSQDNQPPPFPKWWDGKAYNLNYPFDAAEYPSNHRSVYLMTQRFFAHPYLGLFNGPNPNQTTTQRDRADVSTQTLYLLNSIFATDQARAFAKRLLIEPAIDNEVERIGLAFRMAYGRVPENEESKFAQEFLRNARATIIDNHRELGAWSAFAKVLLMSNEFVYLN